MDFFIPISKPSLKMALYFPSKRNETKQQQTDSNETHPQRNPGNSIECGKTLGMIQIKKKATILAGYQDGPVWELDVSSNRNRQTYGGKEEEMRMFLRRFRCCCMEKHETTVESVKGFSHAEFILNIIPMRLDSTDKHWPKLILTTVQ